MKEIFVWQDSIREEIEYHFDSGLVIKGRARTCEPNHFCLDEAFYETPENRGKGFGRQALTELKKKYLTISVHEITDETYGFWEKMCNEGLVTSLDSFWEDM